MLDKLSQFCYYGCIGLRRRLTHTHIHPHTHPQPHSQVFISLKSISLTKRTEAAIVSLTSLKQLTNLNTHKAMNTKKLAKDTMFIMNNNKGMSAHEALSILVSEDNLNLTEQQFNDIIAFTEGTLYSDIEKVALDVTWMLVELDFNSPEAALDCLIAEENLSLTKRKYDAIIKLIEW